MTLQDALHQALVAAREAEASAAAALAAHGRAVLALEMARFVAQQQRRRRVVPGRGGVALLDHDAEARQFVLNRVGRMSFRQIAEDMALAFPEERRLSHGRIWAWAQTHEASEAAPTERRE